MSFKVCFFSPVLHNWTFKSANSRWSDSTLDSKASTSCRFSFASSNTSPVSSWEWLMKTQGDQSDEVSLSRHCLQAWCPHKHLRTFGVVSFFTSISSFSSVFLLIFCANVLVFLISCLISSKPRWCLLHLPFLWWLPSWVVLCSLIHLHSIQNVPWKWMLYWHFRTISMFPGNSLTNLVPKDSPLALWPIPHWYQDFTLSLKHLKGFYILGWSPW